MSIAKLDMHRIGGASMDNLRLKPRETILPNPGISVLKADTPDEAARQMRAAFPKAKKLHEAAKVIASSNLDLIQDAGFDMIHVPSDTFPNHYRIVHPLGSAGFSDQNVAQLSQAFMETTGN